MVTVTDNGTPPFPAQSPLRHGHAAPNQPPVPTAPAITTSQNTAGTSQVSANDPDTGQTATFNVSTAPAHGTAISQPVVGHLHPHAGFLRRRQLRRNGDGQRHATPFRHSHHRGYGAGEPGTRAHGSTLSTPQDTPGTSQVRANDPDTGQSQTFAITTAPARAQRRSMPVAWSRIRPMPASPAPIAWWSPSPIMVRPRCQARSPSASPSRRHWRSSGPRQRQRVWRVDNRSR